VKSKSGFTFLGHRVIVWLACCHCECTAGFGRWLAHFDAWRLWRP